MSEERKTILEWLQTLPEDHPKYGNIRERAVIKYNPDFDSRFHGLSYETTNKELYNAIQCGFNWGAHSTDEYKYWDSVFLESKAGTLFDYQKICSCKGDPDWPFSSCSLCEGTGIIPKQPSPWISVKDRLPEFQNYSGRIPQRLILAGYYHHTGVFVPKVIELKDIGKGYTHWAPIPMPLPEPPKE